MDRIRLRRCPARDGLGHWAGSNRYTGYVNAWLPGNATVDWLARDGNAQIYRVHISGAANKWGPVGEPEPLTFGGSLNTNATIAAGKMAFSSGSQQDAIWSLPADTNQGRVTGGLEKLTTENADYGLVASTPDGKTLAFSSDRAGGPISSCEIWRRARIVRSMRKTRTRLSDGR